MLIYISSIILTALLIRYLFNKKNEKFNNLIEKIPGPTGYPLVGQLLVFSVPIEHYWDIMRKLTSKYYPTLRIWFGFWHAFVSIRHPDDLEVLLSSTKHINKGITYKYFHPWLQTGLLTSGNEKWRTRRKMLTPSFHFNILRKYIEITNENAIKLIEAVRNEGKESTQTLTSFCSKYTLNIILESAMGVNLDRVDKKVADEYRNAVEDITKIIIYRMARPYIFDWMITTLWKIGRIQKRALGILDDFTNKIIGDRKAYHENTGNEYLKELSQEFETPDSDNILVLKSRKQRLAMLDLLISAQKDEQIDDQGIAEEVKTFTFEGHDTTAQGMIFTLMLLSEHEEIQERARAEITEILDRNKNYIGSPELQEMNYLERCIKESLRLYPPVSSLSRTIMQDVHFKDYVVPAGAEVVAQIYDVHRDPDFWDEPNKFDPDRFLPERSNNRHPFSYIPFSAGPRNCIGQKFALMELKSLVARILYNFKLKPIDRLEVTTILLNVVIRPNEEVRIKFIRIDKE